MLLRGFVFFSQTLWLYYNLDLSSNGQLLSLFNMMKEDIEQYFEFEAIKGYIYQI